MNQQTKGEMKMSKRLNVMWKEEDGKLAITIEIDGITYFGSLQKMYESADVTTTPDEEESVTLVMRALERPADGKLHVTLA